MTEFWQQLLALILAPTLVVGAVAWLLRGLVNQGFKRDLERFKSDLERENYERREKFSLIHQRRAEIIAGLYSRIARTKGLLEGLVGIFQQGGQSLTIKKQTVADAYNDAASYFFENRLFLPRETATKAGALLEALRHALIDFDTAQMGNEDYKPDPTGLWVQAYKSVSKDIPPILEELENEFKDILGFIERSS